MKFYQEVSKYSVTKLFKKLDALKSYMLEDKDTKDTYDSLIAVYEKNVKTLNDEINNIMIDPKNEELIKD